MLFVEALEQRTLLSASTINPNLILAASSSSGSSIQGYSPSQIQTAYGFNQVTLTGGVTGDGAGQTIAIVDAYNDPNIASDLATFDSSFGLNAPSSFKVVSQTGSTSNLPQTDSGWAQEISLDVEWAHAMAPKAKILLVEANSSSTTDLLTAVDYARHAFGVTVVSMSWGSSEFSSETSYDSYFTTPSGHKGVTFIAASGDQGSFFGPEWPSSSPYVLSVGGTTLSTDSGGSYSSESSWSNSTGGISSYENQPSYQSSAQSFGARTSPDVSYNADPNTGFAVYDSLANQGQSGWMEIGGTSAGAPQWAALVAVANEGRKLAGEAVLRNTWSTSTILYNLYNSASSYASNFHDVVDSGFMGFQSATAGYDLVTGLGSPIAYAVVTALVRGSNVSQAAFVTASNVSGTTGFKPGFARNHVLPANAPRPPVATQTTVPGNGVAVFSNQRITAATFLSSQSAQTVPQPSLTTNRPIDPANTLHATNTETRPMVVRQNSSGISNNFATSDLHFAWLQYPAPKHHSVDSDEGSGATSVKSNDTVAGLWFDVAANNESAAYVQRSKFWDSAVGAIGLAFMAHALSGKKSRRRAKGHIAPLEE
ncbi:MAG: S53 family peptidase [Planctomycetota bacterium]|nr:S53 family peptidase [Planctomycetota bacterium]